MKITRNQLRQLIKEELVQEILSPTTPVAVKVFSSTKCLQRGMRQLKAYAALKKDEGRSGGMDKYFHVLAFYTAAQVMRRCGVSDTEIRYLLAGLGFAKEILDIGGSGFDSDDMASNTMGVEAALRGASTVEVTRIAADHAASHGLVTWTEFLKRNENVTRPDSHGFVWNDDGYREVYGWALKEYPKLYGEDKLFIKPRYNGLLTPSQRRAAYSKSSPSVGPGPEPRLKIKGPLRLNKPG